MIVLNCVLEKTLESPLDFKEIKPISPKGNQSWIFIGRTDAETESPTLWPHDVKTWLIGKDPDAGKDWKQEEKGRQRMRWVDGITYSMDMSLSMLQEMEKDQKDWHAAVHRVAKSWTRMSDLTRTTSKRWDISLFSLCKLVRIHCIKFYDENVLPIISLNVIIRLFPWLTK